MLKAYVDSTLHFSIYYSTSYYFDFPQRIKRQPIDTLKYFVTTLINQDKKVELIRVDKDGELARPSYFMRICHEMNAVIQTTSDDT